jgi:hypothetical protein
MDRLGWLLPLRVLDASLPWWYCPPPISNSGETRHEEPAHDGGCDGAEFVPDLVNNRSGVGSHFVVADMNGDGMNDIITSANLGTYVFLNLRKKPAPRRR